MTICRKKYKPFPKKWILASRHTGFRRNSALIPANAGLFHYAGNNPVRYIDPDGRLTRTSEIQKKIDELGVMPNKLISLNVAAELNSKKMDYIGNNKDLIDNANSELKALAADETTMIDSETKVYEVVTSKKQEKSLGEKLNYASKKRFGLNTEGDDRNVNMTESATENYTIRVYRVKNVAPNGTESDVYKTFIDVNDDGNIDYTSWGEVKLDD